MLCMSSADVMPTRLRAFIEFIQREMAGRVSILPESEGLIV